MKIQIRFIPHEKQRYPTCGDYWVDRNGNWQIRISKMDDSRSMFAVLQHELIEMQLVIEKGIPIPSIDAFDLLFEDERKRGLHSLSDEPGDDRRAIYFEQHQAATQIERLVCATMNLNWTQHCMNVEALFKSNG